MGPLRSGALWEVAKGQAASHMGDINTVLILIASKFL